MVYYRNIMIAKELIPKLITARTTGNDVVHVVLRLVKGGSPASTAENFLAPMYGDTGTYVVIEHGDSDQLGDLLKCHEIAVRATFDLDSAITHLMSLDPSTRIKT